MPFPAQAGMNRAPQPACRRPPPVPLAKAAEQAGAHKFTKRFLLTEWDQVVDAWQLSTWEEYRDVARLGPAAFLRRASPIDF